jgi:hypothetical protein
MALETADGEHLDYLIDRLGRDPKHKKELSKLKDPASRHALAVQLEQLRQGTVSYLDAAWPQHTGRATHAWEVASLAGNGADELAERVRNGFKVVPFAVGDVHVSPVRLTGDESKARPTMIALSVEAGVVRLELTVCLYKSTSRQFEGQRIPVPFTRYVEIVIEVRPSGCVLEARAEYQDARAATFYVIEQLLGQEIKRQRAAHSAIMTPILFNQSQIRAIAAREKWEEIGEAGRNKGVKYSVRSLPGDGGKLPRLPSLDVLRQDPLSPRHALEYQFAYGHPDEYIELGLVSFHLENVNHPHFTFVNRASRPAMRYIMDLLRPRSTPSN